VSGAKSTRCRGASVAYVTTAFAPSIQSQIDGIRALAAPTADKAAVKTMLDIAQANLNRVRSDPSLLAKERPRDRPSPPTAR
jgi:hypothetical protein